MPGAWGPRLLFPPDANLSSSTHHLHYYLFTPELARVQPPAERRVQLVVYLHGGVKPRGRENNSSALPAEAFHSAGAQLRHPCFVLRPITVLSAQPCPLDAQPCPLSCHPGLRPLVSLGLRPRVSPAIPSVLAGPAPELGARHGLAHARGQALPRDARAVQADAAPDAPYQPGYNVGLGLGLGSGLGLGLGFRTLDRPLGFGLG